MSKVTIIIPAYNAERTLRDTVHSVLEQTLQDIRVLIVDDGSRDGTPAIADRLAREDARVEVIHQTNTGCYGARLSGMKRVRTQYFGFVDSDDRIAPTMYEKMLALAEANDLDIAQCDWMGNGHNKGIPQIFGTREEVVEQIVKPRLVEGVDSMMVWDKIYRNQYDFSTWIDGYFATHEDLIHNMQLFLPAKRVGYLNEELYLYEVTDASSVRNFSERRIEAFRNTIMSHRQLSSRYELDPVEADILCARWIVKNARNLFVLACVAQGENWKSCSKHAKMLLEVPELRAALSLLEGQECRGKNLLRSASRLPLPISITGVKIFKKLQRLLK